MHRSRTSTKRPLLWLRHLASTGLQLNGARRPTGETDSLRDRPVSDAPLGSAIRVGEIQKAFDLGVTLFDAADTYGNGLSEELIAKAFPNQRDEIVIADLAAETD